MLKILTNLEQYQETPEDPEAAKCIPMLKREDIRKEITPFTNEALDIDGSLFLYHEVPTNGIGYLDLMFDLKDLADEKITISWSFKICTWICRYSSLYLWGADK